MCREAIEIVPLHRHSQRRPEQQRADAHVIHAKSHNQSRQQMAALMHQHCGVVHENY